MTTRLQELLGLATIVILVTTSLQLTGCAALEALPPAQAYAPDAQTTCVENHVWGETVLGSAGPSIASCAAVGWSQQRKALDGAI